MRIETGEPTGGRNEQGKKERNNETIRIRKVQDERRQKKQKMFFKKSAQ